MQKKRVSKDKLRERMEIAEKVYAYCVENSVGWNEAARAFGKAVYICRETVREWRNDCFGADERVLARDLIQMILDCNQAFCKSNRVLKTWDDVEMRLSSSRIKSHLFSARQIHKKALSEKVGWADACIACGVESTVYYNILTKWINGKMPVEETEMARAIIDLMLEVNRKHGSRNKYNTWADIEQKMKKKKVSKNPSPVQQEPELPLFQAKPELPLFQAKPVDANARLNSQSLFLVQQLTGKTKQEVTEEAIAMYCKAILKDYVSTL